MAASATYTPKFTPLNDPRVEVVPLGIWAASTAYLVGQILRSGNGTGNYYQCMIAGTSGASAPTWTTTGALVTDNTVTWRDIGVGNPGDLVFRPNGYAAYLSGLTPLSIERTVTFCYNGIGAVPISATAFFDGQDVYFNTTTNLGQTTPPAQGFWVGTARGSVTSSATKVNVWLNGGAPAEDPAVTVAAAGSSQGNAATLSIGFNAVTGANGTVGVILPASSEPGDQVFVKSVTGGSALLVYPPVGAAINAIAANSSLSMASLTAAIFVCVSSTQWYTIPLLPS
jgi:hypothetical protein